jgi:hypothetical protein
MPSTKSWSVNTNFGFKKCTQFLWLRRRRKSFKRQCLIGLKWMSFTENKRHNFWNILTTWIQTKEKGLLNKKHKGWLKRMLKRSLKTLTCQLRLHQKKLNRRTWVSFVRSINTIYRCTWEMEGKSRTLLTLQNSISYIKTSLKNLEK